MLHIILGICIFLIVFPYISGILYFISLVAVAIAVIYAILLILQMYVGLEIVVIFAFVIFCFWVVREIFGKNRELNNQKSSTSEVKNSVSSQISAIGGPKIWIKDFVLRHAPAFTLQQKFQKIEYLESKRPRLFISAANARQLREYKLGEERKLRLLAETKRLDSISEKENAVLEAYKNKKIGKIQGKFCKEIEIIKNKFHSQNNIEFSSSGNRFRVEIYGKDGILIAYELFVEIRISRIPKSSLS